MLSCREASRLSSESLDRRLSLGERCSLWMHLAMCRLCQRFHRQLQFLRRALTELEARADGTARAGLSASARKRIRRRILERLREEAGMEPRREQ